MAITQKKKCINYERVTHQLPKAAQNENELSTEDTEANQEIVKEGIDEVVKTKEETITVGPTTGVATVETE